MPTPTLASWLSLYLFKSYIDIEGMVMDKIKYIYHSDFDDPILSAVIKEYDLFSDDNAFIANTRKHYQNPLPLNEFLNSIRGFGVLQKSSEVMLFKQYNYFKHCYNLTGNNEELVSAGKIKNLIATHNLRLIAKMIITIQQSRHKDTDELLSDCNLWLLRSIESFNVQFNIKFSSYLCKSIWYNVTRFGGKKRITTKSLTIRTDDDGDGDSLEHDPNSAEKEPSYELSIKESKTLLHKVLRSSLNQRELDIIVARYGIDGKPPRTLKEVGELLKLNGERVRQIQATAERKLSKNSELLHGIEAI